MHILFIILKHERVHHCNVTAGKGRATFNYFKSNLVTFEYTPVDQKVIIYLFIVVCIIDMNLQSD